MNKMIPLTDEEALQVKNKKQGVILRLLKEQPPEGYIFVGGFPNINGSMGLTFINNLDDIIEIPLTFPSGIYDAKNKRKLIGTLEIDTVVKRVQELTFEALNWEKK